MNDKPAADDLDLSALEGDNLDAGNMTEAELAESGKEILWLTDEMAPPENIAYSLRRMDAGISELLGVAEQEATALERIATALEKIAARAEKIADAFEMPA